MIVIAKNLTSSVISLRDLYGIEIPGNTSVNLTDIFSFVDIQYSNSLKTAISSGSIIINDGTTDLSLNNSLLHVLGVTKYELNQIDPTPSGKYMQFIFYKAETGNSTYTSKAKFIFEGTDVLRNLINVRIIAKAKYNSSNKLCYVQLFDLTNNHSICSVSFYNTSSQIIQMPSITNVPTGRSIIDVQLKATSNTVTLESLELEFQ